MRKGNPALFRVTGFQYYVHKALRLAWEGQFNIQLLNPTRGASFYEIEMVNTNTMIEKQEYFMNLRPWVDEREKRSLRRPGLLPTELLQVMEMDGEKAIWGKSGAIDTDNTRRAVDRTEEQVLTKTLTKCPQTRKVVDR